MTRRISTFVAAVIIPVMIAACGAKISGSSLTDKYGKYMLAEKMRVYGGDEDLWEIVSNKITIRGHDYYIVKSIDDDIWHIERAANFDFDDYGPKIAPRSMLKNVDVDQWKRFDSLEQLLEYIDSFE